ncbi:MAG TPA: hypothetical protein VGO73_08965 [Pyrinomonadaceae bacterium]|nr:hypothetical protein [Pyrinomonadaceae bacterium]
MSRLDYAPKLKDIQVTDIKKGIGVFAPKPDKPVSFAALKETLKKAGYTLESADITVTGTLGRQGKGWFLTVPASGQRFTLEGSNVDQILAGFSGDAGVEIKGAWKTTGEGANSREVVVPATAKKAAAATTSRVHRRDGRLHAQDGFLRGQDGDLHGKDRISHAQDHELRAQDRILHAQDGGLHAQDHELHAQDRISTAQDRNLHGQDGVSHAQDHELPAQDRLLHAGDGVLRGRDRGLKGKNRTFDRRDGVFRRNSGQWEALPAVFEGRYLVRETRFMPARDESSGDSFLISGDLMEVPRVLAKPPAPIRVTSPGLTVYKGGAVTPRLYFIKQHLGNLEVNRQVFDLSVSYTPSPRVQLEVELPISRTSFRTNLAAGATSGLGAGLGNITLWSKYRFFRKVKTYGDRQAAARFGLELPTGKKDGPTLAQLNAPAFVRQQLTPINGGLSPHFDLAFSQAGGRFIFGGNAEAVVRSERDGFRMGHEVRVSTDTEYVLLPRKYVAPGRELFVILETTFVHRGVGRLGGASVSGSNSTEYFLAPGLQYAMAPQFVIEGSFQFPVIRNTGPLVLRNDRNILFGVRYLF